MIKMNLNAVFYLTAFELLDFQRYLSREGTFSEANIKIKMASWS